MHDRCVRGAVVPSYLLKPFIGTPQDTIIAEASHEDILGGGIVQVIDSGFLNCNWDSCPVISSMER